MYEEHFFVSFFCENRQIAFQNPNLQNLSQVTRIVIAPFYRLPKDLKPAGCLMRGHVAVGQSEATLETSPEASTPPGGLCVFERPEPPCPPRPAPVIWLLNCRCSWQSALDCFCLIKGNVSGRKIRCCSLGVLINNQMSAVYCCCRQSQRQVFFFSLSSRVTTRDFRSWCRRPACFAALPAVLAACVVSREACRGC